MSAGAAFLADHVIGDTAVRQWVLSLPHPLRQLLAYDAPLLTDILGAFIEAVFQFQRWKAKDLLDLSSVSQARPGAITSIQRCSDSLFTNVHFHALITDGVFVQDATGAVTFHQLPAPTTAEVEDVAWETCRRAREVLIRHGRWQDDTGCSTDEPSGTVDAGLADFCAASMRGVLSIGPRRGQRVVRLFGEAARDDGDPAARQTGQGFNVHAQQAIRGGDRAGLERLARYILRPPLANGRLERTEDGRVLLHLKRPWRDGTRALLFEPLDFLSKLTTLIPRPRMKTLRFHGVWAPHSSLREDVVPECEAEKCPCQCESAKSDSAAPINRQHRLSWSQLLKKVFDIDIFTCPRCPGRLQRIAWILDTAAIRSILRAVGLSADSPEWTPARSVDDLFEPTPES